MTRSHRSSDHLSRANSRGSLDRLLFESSPSNGANLHKRPFTYLFMQLIVLIIRLITPVSYFYLFLMWWLHPIDRYFGNQYLFYTFTTWMLVEVVFFPYYFHLFNVLNVSRSPLRHYASTPECRTRLLTNCFNAMREGKKSEDEAHIYLRKVSSTLTYLLLLYVYYLFLR